MKSDLANLIVLWGLREWVEDVLIPEALASPVRAAPAWAEALSRPSVFERLPSAPSASCLLISDPSETCRSSEVEQLPASSQQALAQMVIRPGQELPRASERFFRDVLITPASEADRERTARCFQSWSARDRLLSYG